MFIAFSDAERCRRFYAEFGCIPQPKRTADEEIETDLQRLFLAAHDQNNGRGRVMDCRVGSFVDLWRAWRKASAGDDSFKTDLRRLNYSIETRLAEEIGSVYSCSVALSHLDSNQGKEGANNGEKE